MPPLETPNLLQLPPAPKNARRTKQRLAPRATWAELVGRWVVNELRSNLDPRLFSEWMECA